MELPYGNIRNDSSAHETHDIAHTANGHHEDKGAACGKPPTTLPLAGGEARLHYSLHNGKRTQAQAFAQ